MLEKELADNREEKEVIIRGKEDKREGGLINKNSV